MGATLQRRVAGQDVQPIEETEVALALELGHQIAVPGAVATPLENRRNLLGEVTTDDGTRLGGRIKII